MKEIEIIKLITPVGMTTPFTIAFKGNPTITDIAQAFLEQARGTLDYEFIRKWVIDLDNNGPMVFVESLSPLYQDN